MAKGSRAYAAMRHALLTAVRAIPSGRVVEISTLARALNLPSRHAAHILAGLDPDDADFVPRHRVVPTGGAFETRGARGERHRRQIARLAEEGHAVGPDGRLALTSDVLHVPDDTHRDTLWADIEPDV